MHSKGITLVSLVITIIVLLILSGTAVYTGSSIIQNSNRQKFITELKEIREAVKAHEKDYMDLGLMSSNNEEYPYKFETEQDYKKVGLSNIEQKTYVSFNPVKVKSINGIKIDGMMYYTLKEIGAESYSPEYNEKISSEKPVFEINAQKVEYMWIINVYNVKYTQKAEEGNLLYTEYNKNNWKRAEKIENGFQLKIKDVGKYQLKIRDSNNNESDIKEIDLNNIL